MVSSTYDEFVSLGRYDGPTPRLLCSPHGEAWLRAQRDSRKLSVNASDGIGQWGASRAASWRGSLAQLDGRAPRRFCERTPQAAAGYMRCFRVLDTFVVGVRVRDGWMSWGRDGGGEERASASDPGACWCSVDGNGDGSESDLVVQMGGRIGAGRTLTWLVDLVGVWAWPLPE